MQYTSRNQPTNTIDYSIISGPSFLNELPNHDLWCAFKKTILNTDSLSFAELWFKKAIERNGVPLRKDFSFEELIGFGPNLYMAKLREDNRWQTTFCGGDIVNEVGRDPSGKFFDEFACPETLEFWLENAKLTSQKAVVHMEFYTLEFAGREHRHCAELNLMLKSGDNDFPDIILTHEAFSSKTLVPHHSK